MKKLLRVLAVALLGVGFSTGLASAQTGTIGTTGPDSQNHITFNESHVATVTSSNSAGVTNGNNQSAYSGDAGVKHNTTGGSATSGTASNANSTSTNASMTNSSAAAAATAWGGGGSNSGSINNTGPDSNNTVTFHDNHVMTVYATNTASVSNSSHQTATSGDAKVYDNTTGGNATSGGAMNTSTTSTSLNMSN